MRMSNKKCFTQNGQEVGSKVKETAGNAVATVTGILSDALNEPLTEEELMEENELYEDGLFDIEISVPQRLRVEKSSIPVMTNQQRHSRRIQRLPNIDRDIRITEKRPSDSPVPSLASDLNQFKVSSRPTTPVNIPEVASAPENMQHIPLNKDEMNEFKNYLKKRRATTMGQFNVDTAYTHELQGATSTKYPDTLTIGGSRKRRTRKKQHTKKRRGGRLTPTDDLARHSITPVDHDPDENDPSMQSTQIDVLPDDNMSIQTPVDFYDLSEDSMDAGRDLHFTGATEGQIEEHVTRLDPENV